MAYKIKQEGSGFYTIEPRNFLSGMSYRDLVTALAELSNRAKIVQVVRYLGTWGNRKYLVVTEER